jgi:hypothetical protein
MRNHHRPRRDVLEDSVAGVCAAAGERARRARRTSRSEKRLVDIPVSRPVTVT